MAAMGPHVEPESEVLEKHAASGPVARSVPVTMLTPRGPVLEREVDEIIAPGADGEFGVLPGHVAFLSALKPGVLTIRTGKSKDVYAVGGGYLEVGAGGVTKILVDEALPAADIDAAAAQAQKSAAEAALRELTDPTAAAPSRRQLAWAQARLDAVAAAQKA
jgi:F-type H+-transporting ATPase subunit epsilon